MKSTICNTSKEMMAYSDFPPSANYPNFMHNSLIRQYLQEYAENFDLLKEIRFNTSVEKVRQFFFSFHCIAIIFLKFSYNLALKNLPLFLKVNFVTLSPTWKKFIGTFFLLYIKQWFFYMQYYKNSQFYFLLF